MSGKRKIEMCSLSQRHQPLSVFLAMFFPALCLLLLMACGGGSKTTEMKSTAEEGPVAEEAEPYISEFILGAGDKLSIEVWGHDDLNKAVQLDYSGEFFYPFVGYVHAAGMSIKDLRQTIDDGLGKYYVDPQVGVEVVSLRSQKTFVLGEVIKPGVFALVGTTTALEGIAKAGGFNDDANKSSVILIRGDFEDPELRRLDIEGYLTQGKGGENVTLMGGDVLYVPRSFIGDVRSFFNDMQTILRPIVQLERAIILEPAVENVLEGEERTGVRVR